jgi:hypothetical protein
MEIGKEKGKIYTDSGQIMAKKVRERKKLKKLLLRGKISYSK